MRHNLKFVVIGIVIAALLLPGVSLAQEARVSMGVGGGVNLPLSVSERFVPRFQDFGTGTIQGQSYLVHQRPAPAMSLQLEALIRTMYIRYRFNRGGWIDDTLRCVPSSDNTGSALLLPSGEIDDRSMLYDCSVDRHRVSPDPDRRRRSTHHIVAGIEIRAVERFRLIPYATVGGGMILTQYHPAAQGSSVRFGLNVQGGGGVYFPIDRNLSVFAETQYSLTLMGRGGNYSLRAGRAVAANKTVLSAVIDPQHAFDVMVGIRFRVR